MGTEIIVAVGTALILGLGTIAYRMLKRGILAYLRDDIKAHLIPNGGSSLADRLTDLEQAVDKLTKEAETTGCLPGCPMRQGMQSHPMMQWENDGSPTRAGSPAIGTPAPWSREPSYGPPPD